MPGLRPPLVDRHPQAGATADRRGLTRRSPRTRHSPAAGRGQLGRGSGPGGGRSRSSTARSGGHDARPILVTAYAVSITVGSANSTTFTPLPVGLPTGNSPTPYSATIRSSTSSRLSIWCAIAARSRRAHQACEPRPRRRCCGSSRSRCGRRSRHVRVRVRFIAGTPRPHGIAHNGTVSSSGPGSRRCQVVVVCQGEIEIVVDEQRERLGRFVLTDHDLAPRGGVAPGRRGSAVTRLGCPWRSPRRAACPPARRRGPGRGVRHRRRRGS